MKQLSSEPPILFSDFIKGIGVTNVTGWRWRKDGLIKTFNINGRQYLSRDELRRFNARAEGGEFSKEHPTPSNRKNK